MASCRSHSARRSARPMSHSGQQAPRSRCAPGCRPLACRPHGSPRRRRPRMGANGLSRPARARPRPMRGLAGPWRARRSRAGALRCERRRPVVSTWARQGGRMSRNRSGRTGARAWHTATPDRTIEKVYTERGSKARAIDPLHALAGALVLGAIAGCTRVPERVEATPEPRGDPRHGEYLTALFACQECHTLRQADGLHLDPALLFAGGIPFEGPWGLVHSANVSVPAGAFPDAVLEDAIRGRLTYKFQMPTDLYRGIAADDMRDVVAFIKTLKPVSRPLPENRFEPQYRPPGPLAEVPVLERAPAPGTPERGMYLTRVAMCQDCHSPRASDGAYAGTGPDAGYDMRHLFGGGGIAFHWKDGRWLIPPNLTPDPESGIGGWSEADIVKAMRTGMTPDGRQLNPMMPYNVAFRDMTDQDALDIARFLRSLPPVRSGRPPNPPFVASDPPPDCCFEPPPDPLWSQEAPTTATPR